MQQTAYRKHKLEIIHATLMGACTAVHFCVTIYSCSIRCSLRCMHDDILQDFVLFTTIIQLCNGCHRYWTFSSGRDVSPTNSLSIEHAHMIILQGKTNQCTLSTVISLWRSGKCYSFCIMSCVICVSSVLNLSNYCYTGVMYSKLLINSSETNM